MVVILTPIVLMVVGIPGFFYPSSQNHGSVEKMGYISNIRFLSFRVIFHSHDYGRKGKLFKGNLTDSTKK